MTPGDGYALDLLSPVRHVATEMERAGPDGPALTIEAMAATYEHTIVGDLARIRQHEGAGSDYEARLWLIRKAVSELGRQVAPDGNGGYLLAKPFDGLRYKGRKLHRAVSEDEEDEKRALRAVYNDLSYDRPFHVVITGARGGSREAALTLHPLARVIPQMPEEEFAAFAADVKANGVRLPLHVMGAQVIDGRHRLAVASALKIPVRVEEFIGTEQDARQHIVSLNLSRRHLSIAQRTLIVREIFLPEAEAEAQARQTEAGGDRKSEEYRSAPAGASRSAPVKKAAEVAAERSMGLASARSIERMAPVDSAPETRERIRRGEIKTAMQARKEALKETGEQAPQDVGVLKPRTAMQHLSCALRDVRRACEDVETKTAQAGDVPYQTLQGRIAEVKADLDRLEKLTAQEEGYCPTCGYLLTSSSHAISCG